MELCEALSTIYNIPENKHSVTPIVFMGDKYLLQEKARWKNLENIILLGTPDLTTPPWEKAEEYKDKSGISIIERFKSFGVITIVFAGLIDGINPCAFATIIFLVSYLSLLGRKGKEVLLIGFSYTLAVFLTYFLIGMLGLSILEKIRQFNTLTIITNIIFIVTGMIAIVLAIYSLYDYYLFRKSRNSEMVLQLPRKIKLKIHKIIREKTKVHHFVIGSFVIGFLVSIQELFCTGQVYLPTLVYMSNLMEYRSQAYLYLVLYNLLFILPLVVIFLLIYWGISSKKLGNWVQRKTGLTKILMSLIFFALGIILIYAGLNG
jgi:cytochrome c biogenesis protein CcdA